MSVKDNEYTTPDDTYIRTISQHSPNVKIDRRDQTLTGDDRSAWSLCTIEVALNGQDFYSIDTNTLPFYVYDASRVYFNPTSLAPLIGPNTGDTEIILNLPTNFPFFDPASFYDFQEGIVSVEPIDKIIIMYRKKNSKEGYKEFAVGKVENGLAPSSIYAYTPNMNPGTYTVSLSHPITTGC